MPPKGIILDTSVFYALISSTDRFHTKAKLSYERLLDWEWELWTTSYILVETSVLVYHRLGFESLETFMETMQAGFVKILWIESTLHNEAWRRMRERRGRFSFVDWTTIVSAEHLRASVFTFDQDFRQEGISVFPRQ